VLHLSPADSSGYEVCPMRSKGCTKACLNYSGFQYPRKYNARIAKTELFFQDRAKFFKMLIREIGNLEKRAAKLDLRPGVRLNGTSDIPWERIKIPNTPYTIMDAFPDVMFMDYTKRPNRVGLPDNYKLVFSRSEDNDHHCEQAIDNGMNVAVVFADFLPDTYRIGKHVLPVIDGDAHDWRYGEYEIYDHRVCVGLLAKGLKAKNDQSGFVVKIVNEEAAA